MNPLVETQPMRGKRGSGGERKRGESGWIWYQQRRRRELLDVFSFLGLRALGWRCGGRRVGKKDDIWKLMVPFGRGCLRLFA